jgi:hypothetical protein
MNTGQYSQSTGVYSATSRGIHIAAPANRSTEKLSPRNGRAPTHALVQPQEWELRVEGGAKER